MREVQGSLKRYQEFFFAQRNIICFFFQDKMDAWPHRPRENYMDKEISDSKLFFHKAEAVPLLVSYFSFAVTPNRYLRQFKIPPFLSNSSEPLYVQCNKSSRYKRVSTITYASHISNGKSFKYPSRQRILLLKEKFQVVPPSFPHKWPIRVPQFQHRSVVRNFSKGRPSFADAAIWQIAFPAELIEAEITVTRRLRYRG